MAFALPNKLALLDNLANLTKVKKALAIVAEEGKVGKVKIKPLSTPAQIAKAHSKAEKVFGKEVKKIISRERNNGAGKASKIEFKDGTIIDINAERVKMYTPTLQNPNSSMEKHNFYKQRGLPEGTQVINNTGNNRFKRTLTKVEIQLLEDLMQ